MVEAATQDPDNTMESETMLKQRMLEAIKAKKPELFAKIDRNGDGTLSREEAQAARGKMKNHRGERRDDRRGQAD
jgi:hypothetical protein